MEQQFSPLTALDVVEQYTSTGSTDFWGIQPVSSEKLERDLALMRAGWEFFDSVRFRVSAELRKDLRGGERDRDQIVQHTWAVEKDWATGLGLYTDDETPLTEETVSGSRHLLQNHSSYHAEGRMAAPSGIRPIAHWITPGKWKTKT
jgi:hypothetical protein